MQKKISENKKKIVEELSSLIKNKKTILVASIQGIPASQFQEISKMLKEKAVIRVPKKNLILRAIDLSGNEEIKKMKEKIKENIAVLFSDLDSFELALELVENKSPVKAKIGQEALKDIEIPAGPTDLVPGPAISELGALGIQVKVEGGKLTIVQPKIIVKKGEKISENATGIMNKLNIRPFLVGMTPVAAFDNKENKIYLNIKIDREKTLEELKTSYRKSLSFAVEISYICKETVRFLISKAVLHEKALEKLIQKTK